MRSRIRYGVGVANEAWRRFIDDDHFVYAGHMAFTLLLSFGPFIVCAILLVQHFDPLAAPHFVEMIESVEGRLIPEPMADVLKRVIASVAPGDMAIAICGPEQVQATVQATLASNGSTGPCTPQQVADALSKLGESSNVQSSFVQPSDGGGVDYSGMLALAVTIFVGLYAASSAFEAARNGFNEAYDVKDRRGFLWKRFQSHLLALVLVGLFVFVSLGFVFITFRLSAQLQQWGMDPARTLSDEYWELGGLGLAAFLGASMFWSLLVGIHLTLPRGYVRNWALYVWAQDEIDDRRAVRVPVRPGVWVSAALWFAFAVCFSYVLGALVSFETNHGVLAGVVATLLFFYLSAVTIFFGAQVNIA
ncbi:MAG: YihY/virulence factor BrkB family protein, partial [Rhodobacteraceae bacterium]|nr:YihY/virulence factor BrkB family protein [Paracoccaceae bacterium]